METTVNYETFPALLKDLDGALVARVAVVMGPRMESGQPFYEGAIEGELACPGDPLPTSSVRNFKIEAEGRPALLVKLEDVESGRGPGQFGAKINGLGPLSSGIE